VTAKSRARSGICLREAYSGQFRSKHRREHSTEIPHQNTMGWSDTGFFREQYRVVAVEAERLTIKGIITGTVLTIINSDPATPLTAEQYPLGKLIALSDPSASAPN